MSDHVEELVWDWFHGALEAAEERQFDEHVAHCDRCQRAVDSQVYTIVRVAGAAAPVTGPPPDDLLSRATAGAKFGRFTDQVARLTDVTLQTAKRWLEQLYDTDVWTETALGELQLFHIDGGPTVQDAAIGFVKLAGGTAFPHHTHVGVERTLIVQGTMRDENGELHGPGTLVERDAGTEHEIAAEGDHELIYLSVVVEGIEIFGMRFGPGSPDF